MRKLIKLFLAVAIIAIVFVQSSYAQLTGIKTIPGDYATITAAIADLNAQGVGSGGVTFNIAADYTESTTDQLTITATGTSSNPIVFRKSGTGANPKVTRTDAGTLSTSSLGAYGDAVIRLDGTDYITFNGIDVAASLSTIEYGYYAYKQSGTDGCQNDTIKNSTVTMTKGTSAYVIGIYLSNGSTSTSSATGVTVTATSGENLNFVITGDTVQNVFAGIVARGSSATGFYDNNIVIGQQNAGNVIINYGASSAAATYGVYFIYVNNPTVAYNVINNTAGGGNVHASTLYGIFYSTTSGDFVGNYNTITLSNSGTSAINWIYNANNGTTENFNYNTFAAGTFTSTTASYLIYSSNGTPVINVIGNRTSGTITKTGAGNFLGYYNYGSPGSGTVTISNNNFSNITLTGASTFYGIQHYTSTTQACVITGDTISNITGGSSALYGIFQGYGAAGSTVNGNLVSNFTGTGAIYGISVGNSSAPISLSVYNNNVNNLVTTGASTIYGIQNVNGTANYIYKNKVYNLQANNASGFVYGIQVSGGTLANIYNNFISDLTSTLATGANAINGIYISGGTTVNLYYNTVYINATSTGTTFGSSAVYKSSTTTSDFRNNIFVNMSTPGSTSGNTVALRWSGAYNATYYNAASNGNDLYAGTPAANRLIYFDGTNSDQTISTYKSRVYSRDVNSFSELPPFMNVSTTPYDLHLNPLVPTLCESGGSVVISPAITDDFDGQQRFPNPGYPDNPSKPAYGTDVGADEFAGIWIDILPPTITFTPLLNTSSTASRNLTTIITDPSGVPTSGTGLPVLYWKKNSGTYNSAIAVSAGSSQYTFNFGSGVATGDTVYYFIVAQDGITPPNVGSSPSPGATGFTSNPPACSTPPTTPYKYLISQSSLSGDYSVGISTFNKITGKNITLEKSFKKIVKKVFVEDKIENKAEKKGDGLKSISSVNDNPAGHYESKEVEVTVWTPMENGKPYTGELYIKKSESPNYSYPDNVNGIYATLTAATADLNLRGVSGPTRFLLTDTVYATETFPILVNIQNDNVPTVANTVTIKPNTGVTARIYGAAASTQIFRVINNYVTIDGSNTSGGTTKNLTIQNTSTTSPSVLYLGSVGTNPLQNVTIKNTTIINGVNTSSALILRDSSGSAGYFNNITIQNNSVQLAYIGMYCNAVQTGTNGNGLLITGNDLTSTTNQISSVGIYVQGAYGAAVTNNMIGNFNTTTTNYRYGIWFATGTNNSTISGNDIGNLNTSTSYYPYGIALTPSIANANITVSGNNIHDFTSTSTGDAVTGIYVGGASSNIKIQKNKINHMYNTSSSGYGAWGICLSSSLAAASIEVSNNMISDIYGYGYASTLYENGVGIFMNTGGGYNVYFNSINLFTSQTSGISMCLYATSSVSNASSLDIRNNIFTNLDTTNTNYCLYFGSTNAIFSDINYNDYYTSSATTGKIGFIGGVAKTTLADWQGGTGKDLNSISGNPFYISNTNLHIDTTQASPVGNAGQYIPLITDDIDGNLRNTTMPDIGASEFKSAVLAPSLISPANNSIDLPSSVTFVWSKTNDAKKFNKNFNNNKSSKLPVDKYWLEYSNDPAFTTSIIDTTITDTTKTVSGFGTNTTYYWRVKAHDQYGWSSYSVVWNFTTKPNSPNSPVLLIPANNASNQPYTNLTFVWSKAIETFAKAKQDIGTKSSPLNINQYWFELSTDSNFATVAVRDSSLTDTTKTVATLTSNTSYFWRVKAKNQTGWGTFSNFFRFKTTLDPTYLAQANFISVLTPQFMVSGTSTRLPIVYRATVSNLVPNKLYRYYTLAAANTDLGTSSSGAGILLLINNDSTKFRYFSTGSLTTSYDQFRADASGNYTGWFAFLNSGNARFAAGKYVMPAITLGDSTGTLISRLALNDSIKILSFSTTAADTSATGIWGISVGFPTNMVTLYDNTNGTGRPVSQTLIENDSATMASLVGYYTTNVEGQNGRWGTLIPNILANGIRRIEQRSKLTGDVMTFNSSATGVWTSGVNTVNPTGGTTPLALQLIDAPLLDYPVLVSPVNNAVNQPLTLVLKWNNVNYASSYKVQLATDSLFTTIVKDSVLVPDSLSVSGLIYGQKYWWRVAGVTPSGNGPFGNAFKFTTLTIIPVAPVLSAPSNGATGISVTPVMSWNTVLYAISYRLQISMDSLFATTQWDTAGIPGLTVTVPAGKLTYGSKYYWRVNATNAAGTGPYSAKWNFTTLTRPALSLKVFLEGFYKSTTGTQVSDTIKVYLADSTQGYAFVDSAKIVLNDTGKATMSMTRITGGKYFIVIRHRNHLETWSKYAVSFSLGSSTSYDFTTAATQAYGSNMKQVGSVWVLYGGDANQDGDISALDVPIFVSQFGTQGYLAADFNGDGDVTGLDAVILVANFGLSKVTPAFEAVAQPPEVINKKREEIQKQINDKIQQSKNQQWFDRNRQEGKKNSGNKN